MHQISEPNILYFGTPVVLISTCNEDGTYNLAPISSIFWLGWRCIIGIAGSSKTTQNIKRTGQCVLNLPSINQVEAVNRLARTTGTNPVPPGKLKKGYRYEADKFAIAGFTPIPSYTVEPPRVQECPVQMEAGVVTIHSLAAENEQMRGNIFTIELRIQKIHLEEAILMDGYTNRVDPDKWRPLIMSFQQFYGLGEKLQHSTLGEIAEDLYRTSDIDRAREMNENGQVLKSA